jgi:hypothetical protein
VEGSQEELPELYSGEGSKEEIDDGVESCED